MERCPACGAEVGDTATGCPGCQLSVALFASVREAAGPADAGDPVFLRTIGELLKSVEGPADAPASPDRAAPAVLGASARFPSLAAAEALPAERPARDPAIVAPLDQMPALPAASSIEELRRRAIEYSQLGRRMGLDFGQFAPRIGAANLSGDDRSLADVVREMFVHLAGALAEEYESELARRNEFAQLVPTPSADVEFDAIRTAMVVGDLAGAQRRLVHVRDELGRVEEEWATGRILATECDLLAETIRELGGDPGPALGPLEEGRRSLAAGQRERAERLLARAAYALWALLEGRFFEDLKRLRDRLVQSRPAGVDLAPATEELRAIAVELKQRNFAGAITAYRRLRGFVDGTAPPPVGPPAEAAPSPAPDPPAPSTQI